MTAPTHSIHIFAPGTAIVGIRQSVRTAIFYNPSEAQTWQREFFQLNPDKALTVREWPLSYSEQQHYLRGYRQQASHGHWTKTVSLGKLSATILWNPASGYHNAIPTQPGIDEEDLPGCWSTAFATEQECINNAYQRIG